MTLTQYPYALDTIRNVNAVATATTSAATTIAGTNLSRNSITATSPTSAAATAATTAALTFSTQLLQHSNVGHFENVNPSEKSKEHQLIPLFYEMLAAFTTTITTTTAAATATTTTAHKTITSKITTNASDKITTAVLTTATTATIAAADEYSYSSILPAINARTAAEAATAAFIQISNSTQNNNLSSSMLSSGGGGGGGSSSTDGSDGGTIATPFVVDAYFIGMAWPKVLIVGIFLLLILVTVIGNTLVILAVLTTRRLRTVTNCFVMNLAITDWLVGTCVMPPAVILYIVGTWRFGWILCDIWISLDVLLCTGSILSLCAISLDRYLAVTQPLTYSKKRRSKRLALFMIFIVWVTALSITCPPYLGWYEPGRRQKGYVDCRYNQNKGYVVFSAMGSFFIPLSVMLYVYLKIGYVLTSRRQRIVRDANSERAADHEIDCDNFLSESEHFQCATPKFPSFKTRWGIYGMNSDCSSKTNSLKCSKCDKNYIEEGSLRHQASFYELIEISRLSTFIHSSHLNCKYSDTCVHVAVSDRRGSMQPIQTTTQYIEGRPSISESLSQTPTQQHQHNNHSNHQHHHHQQQQQQQSHNQHSHHRIPMRISTSKRDTKTAKTLSIVMGGFIACWLPFFIYYLLIPFLPPAARLEELMSVLTWIGWVNCAINPFIYAFYNPDFRTAFWRLTCRPICKPKPASNHMAMFRG